MTGWAFKDALREQGVPIMDERLNAPLVLAAMPGAGPDARARRANGAAFYRSASTPDPPKMDRLTTYSKLN